MLEINLKCLPKEEKKKISHQNSYIKGFNCPLENDYFRLFLGRQLTFTKVRM